MVAAAENFPVAHFIREEMEARAWSIADLLNRMPGDRRVNECWLEIVFAAPEFPLQDQLQMHLGDPSELAHAFGTSKEFWTNLDDAYRAFVRRRLGGAS